MECLDDSSGVPLVYEESSPVYYPTSPWPGHQYVNHPGRPGAVLTSQGGGHGAKLYCTHGKLYCTQYFTIPTGNWEVMYSVFHCTHWKYTSIVFSTSLCSLKTEQHCTQYYYVLTEQHCSEYWVYRCMQEWSEWQSEIGLQEIGMQSGSQERDSPQHGRGRDRDRRRYPSIEASSLPGARRCFVPLEVSSMQALGWGSSANGNCHFSQCPSQIVM